MLKHIFRFIKKMEIVKASLNDAENIANIEFNNGYYWSNYSIEKEIKLAGKMLKQEKEEVFLVKDNNKFIAYISINIENSEGELGMSVLKNEQSKGIGSLMLKHINEYAKLKNCKKLKLDVWSGNLNAIKVYEKFKFKVIYEKKNFYKNGDSLFHMELNL